MLIISSAAAEWRADAGYFRLQTELGGAMPTGAGIAVLQSEASYTAPPTVTYLPQATAGNVSYAGTGSFAGKSFFPASGASAASPHSAAVGAFFYGSSSVSPGVNDVVVWLADDFIGYLYDPTPTFGPSVMNHSWVGSTGDDAIDIELCRKLDFLIERDGVVSTAPLNNGVAQAKLLSNTYHTLSVGLKSGNHPTSDTNLDVLGRMKPDLVVDQPFTSYAGPSVGSAAALLLDVIRPAYPVADDPRVVKALLVTAGSKDRLPTWRRTLTSRPYDGTHGAGELDVYQAYHCLTAGQQTASNALLRTSSGWDKGTASSSAVQRYFFSVGADQWLGTFSASVTWHRQFSSGVSVATLANLNLTLRSSAGLVPGAIIDQSVSSIDNVEHLFLRHLQPGEYVLEVSSDSDSIPFGLAWRSVMGVPPQLSLQRTGSTSQLQLSGLDPWMLYTLQGSTNLTSWSSVTTLRTGDTVASFTATLSEVAAAPWKFYRLSWVR
jgi:hypothetical protein